MRLPLARLVGALVVLLLVARYAGGVGWAARAALGLVLGYAVLRVATATLLPLRPGERTYEPVDVVEPGGVPVYTCAECGTQLVLLRRGSDKPPRHCGEAMRYALVPEG